MFFCPNCNNSLSITQSQMVTNTEKLSETPTTVSSSSEENENTEIETKNILDTSTGTNVAYYKCSNCGYLQELEQGTLILTRTSEKATSNYTVDQNKYKDMIYDMTLPHTRNYICPNKFCQSHTDYTSREAVWFKPNRQSYNIVTVCLACQTVW